MLEINVGETEHFDEAANKFVYRGGTKVRLEHSLVSLSKWEAKYEKAFFGKQPKEPEEVMDYLSCMLLDDFPPEVFREKLSDKNVAEIQEYLDKSMTATWFPSDAVSKSSSNPETVTSELIYYWMSSFAINWQAQHWHLNRLFTLIRVHSAKSEPPKKRSQAEIAARNRKLNQERRARMQSTG